MRKKRAISLTEGQLKQVVKESVVMVLESVSEEPLRIEDYFDLNAISEKDIRSIATDLRIYLGHNYGSDLTDEGELIIKEGASVTMPIGQLRKELKSLGFKQWQIKSEIVANRVRIVILYADIAMNTNIIINKMLSCGWTKARISDPLSYGGTMIRVMDFDPKEQKSLTKEARRYAYLYHWTPYKNLSSILSIGIEVRSENDYLSYPPTSQTVLRTPRTSRQVRPSPTWTEKRTPKRSSTYPQSRTRIRAERSRTLRRTIPPHSRAACSALQEPLKVIGTCQQSASWVTCTRASRESTSRSLLSEPQPFSSATSRRTVLLWAIGVGLRQSTIQATLGDSSTLAT